MTVAQKFGRALRTRAAFQDTFDTYASAEFMNMMTYKRGDPDSPALSDDPLLGQATANNRDATAPLVGMPQGSVQRTVPLALGEIGMWLAACFGMPTTSGSAGNFVHTFASGGESLAMLTIEDLLAAGLYRYHRGVVVDGLSIQATKENAYPQVVLDLLMRDFAQGTTALAGDDAETQFTVQRPPAWQALAKWNDTAIGEATTATINYKNNSDRWMGLSGDSFPVQIDPGLASVSGSVGLRFSTDTYHTLANNGGAAGKLSLIWALPGALTTRLLQVDLNLVRLSASGQPVEGAGEITSSFNIRGEQSDSVNAVTVTLKNDVETYVPDDGEGG